MQGAISLLTAAWLALALTSQYTPPFAQLTPDQYWPLILVSDLPGVFQYRSAFVHPPTNRVIVASTNHILALHLGTLREAARSHWLPSAARIDRLLANHSSELWTNDERFCRQPRTLHKLGETTHTEWALNLTCRWFFLSLHPGEDGTFWSCLSKQTLSGCVQFNTTTLQPTAAARQRWPTSPADPAFQGSVPESPWLADWTSHSLSFISHPGPSSSIAFFGNTPGSRELALSLLPEGLTAQLLPESQAAPVKVLTVGDYTYLFFHDNANEASSSYYDFDMPDVELRRYSRVARVCTNNKSVNNERHSLVYARLICGVRRDTTTSDLGYPLMYLRTYDVLSDVTMSQGVIYAAFNSDYPLAEGRRSAVCAYSVADIDSVLDSGQVKVARNQRSDNHLSWTLSDSSAADLPAHFGTCRESGGGGDQQQSTTSMHILMHRPVEPLNRTVLFKSDRFAIEKLACSAPHLDTQYLFLATPDSTMVKVAVGQRGTSVLVHELALPPPSNIPHDHVFPAQTHFMMTHDDSVLIGRTWAMYKVPQWLCPLYASCWACLTADPACSWVPETGTCQRTHPLAPDTYTQIGSAAECTDGSEDTYQVQLLAPLPETQHTTPVLAGSTVSIFCGARHALPSGAQVHLLWYENTRQVSGGGGSQCGSVGVNVVNCTTPSALPGVQHSILTVHAMRPANYTCLVKRATAAHGAYSTARLEVVSVKEHAERLYLDYLGEMRRYYTSKCETQSYCSAQGCGPDNRARLSHCLQSSP